MATITEKDISNFLMAKVKSLKEELNKAEEALAYFSKMPSTAKRTYKKRSSDSPIEKIAEKIVKAKKATSKSSSKKKTAKAIPTKPVETSKISSDDNKSLNQNK